MHHLNATLINLYHVCQREMWLHAHHIRMEHNSDIVLQGKIIGESSYPDRAEKNRELAFDLPEGISVKMDFYDAATRTVHETKKSDKAEAAHLAQVKFYLWALERAGITDAQGVLEYPRLRTREVVKLNDDDRAAVVRWIDDIRALLDQDQCPSPIKKRICASCSYYDYCYATE